MLPEPPFEQCRGRHDSKADAPGPKPERSAPLVIELVTVELLRLCESAAGHSGLSENAANDGLNIKSVGDKLPRRARAVISGYSDLVRRQSLGVIVVEVFSPAVRDCARVFMDVSVAPRMSLVEHARHPRPPPLSGIYAHKKSRESATNTRPARLFDVPHSYEGNSLMACSDDRESTSRRQDKTITPPAIQPGGLYTRKQLLNNLKISPSTLTRWQSHGLMTVEPLGAGSHMFLADDILEFMKSLRTQKG